MELHKMEADHFLKIGKKYICDNNYQKAIEYLYKSYKLHPLKSTFGMFCF